MSLRFYFEAIEIRRVSGTPVVETRFRFTIPPLPDKEGAMKRLSKLSAVLSRPFVMPSARWIPFLLVTACVIQTLAAGGAVADDGEFWDAGVASILDTKRMHRSYLKLDAGAGVLHDVDQDVHIKRDPPADSRFMADAFFYGVKLNRHERLFTVYGNIGLGSHDRGGWQLDGYRARLSVYSFINGGMLRLGTMFCEREKALNEKFVATVHPFEYAAGGAMRMLVLTVNAKAFGYEFRRYFSRDDYHGMQLFLMNIRAGLVFGKHTPITLETSVSATVGASWHKRKDFSSAFETIVHWNNRVLPMMLAAKAEYRYASDDRDKNVKSDFHDSYYIASVMLGARF